MRFDPEYVKHVLNDNFEDAKTLFLSPLLAVHHAHLVMLAECGILDPAVAHRLRVALDSISVADVRCAVYDGSCEDLFFYVERLLVAACGEDAAGRLRTARSRNDIDMTMYRMQQRECVAAVVAATLELRAALIDLAAKHRETVFAAHTHTQPAQPTTVAHYLLAMIEQLERDAVRLRAAYASTNRSPLGACAITGTGFAIDRSLTSDLLGFDGATGNTYGSIATVDYLLESVSARPGLLAGSGGSFRVWWGGSPGGSATRGWRTASCRRAASCRRSATRLPSNTLAASAARRSARRWPSSWPFTTRRLATWWTSKTTCSRSSQRRSATHGGPCRS